jgi:hypothetical protein
MSYPCEFTGRDTCNVVPYYSSNGYFIDNTPIGSPAHDNARLIRENAPVVAGWKSCKINCGGARLLVESKKDAGSFGKRLRRQDNVFVVDHKSN